jgi:hypothetical protein
MCEDFVRQYSEESGLLFALVEVKKMLNYGLSLQELHLPVGVSSQEC